MRAKIYLFPVLLIGALFLLLLRALLKPAAAKQVARPASYEEIEFNVLRQMRRLSIPGAALAVVDGDQIAHLRGFGRARPDGERPTAQTPFFIASLTKSFTALAVMQLVEAGQINLDDPVQRYLPWFRVADSQASAQITVRHLLNQTSGLPTLAGEIPLADFDQRPGAAERQACALATIKLKNPVGTAFEYSNANYNLLGLVIEVASGETYADYIQKNLFVPLEMSHSYTSPSPARQNGLAVGHRFWFAHPFAAPNTPIPYGSLASGQLISSAEDMAHYMTALLNEGRYGDATILSSAGIEQLFHGAADFSMMGLSLGQYGMGWFVDEIGGTKLLWHSGTNPDFAAYMALLPEQKKGVVLLFNADHHWMNPVVADFGAQLAAMLAGKRPQPLPMVRTIPWMLRALLIIPVVLAGSILITLRLVQRWQNEPGRRPSGSRKWLLHITLPLLLNLLLALTLAPMLGSRRGYLMLYMPDYAWTAMVCGSSALLWGLVRTGLVLRALRPASPGPANEG